MLAIYKRELKSYFRSFIGFLFIAVTLFFLGLYFSVYNLMNGYPYFAYVVSRDRKSTRLNSSHWNKSRMPSSA